MGSSTAAQTPAASVSSRAVPPSGTAAGSSEGLTGREQHAGNPASCLVNLDCESLE